MHRGSLFPRTPILLLFIQSLLTFMQSLLALWRRFFHLVCPVHALHIYLHHTKCTHGPNNSLFVHWDEGRAHHPVSKRWISSCLTEAIHSYYHHQGWEHGIIHANPHSTWGVAASWAEIARVLALEICRVATLSGLCTFARFYHLDFSGGGFATAIIEAAARAQ